MEIYIIYKIIIKTPRRRYNRILIITNYKLCDTTVDAYYIVKNIFITIIFFSFRINFRVACGGGTNAHVPAELGQLGSGLSALTLLRNANASVLVYNVVVVRLFTKPHGP